MEESRKKLEVLILKYQKLDKITDAMKGALDETDRRREKQVAYNKKHGITPETIIKAVKDITLHGKREEPREKHAKVPKEEMTHLIKTLEDQMDLAAHNLEFEKAAELRDEVDMLRSEFNL